MRIKILSNKRNELLKRSEVIFTLSHEGGPTPSRVEARRDLANTLHVNDDKVYIKKMETATGTTITVGEAHIYDSLDQAKILEPKHIIIRNTPQKRGNEEVDAKER
ncbi:MAG: 30S ribosomal protein S24e [Candidatus Bathyarchaeia archaeon]